MRQLIVKYFALDYVFKAFGMSLTVTRSSVFIYPLMAITGLLWVSEQNIFLVLFSAILTLICLFLGFVYFDFNPVKFKELDKLQGFSYGVALEKKIIDKDSTFSAYALMVYKDWVYNTIESRRFYKPFLYFTFHPLFQSFFWLIIGYFILTN